MVINSTAARTIWGTDDPLTTPVPRDDRAINVVGIAGDVRYEDIESEPKPAIFFPVTQMNRSRAMLFVRTAGDPASLANAVRNVVRSVDRNHTVSDVQTLRHRMYEATARDRFATQVLSAFAVTALVLAAIGIYGVLSLAVAQRRREIGIRMALGAERGGVLAMILAQAMSIAAAGGCIGAAGALFAGRALGGMLYGSVRPTRSRTSCVGSCWPPRYSRRPLSRRRGPRRCTRWWLSAPTKEAIGGRAGCADAKLYVNRRGRVDLMCRVDH